MKQSIKAFTLIELVVVIAIIGILTAFAVPNFMAARERARDIQRKNDLKQLQNVLEMYKLDYGKYPTNGLFDKMKEAASICWYNDTVQIGLGFGSTCAADKVVYMKKVLRDPNRVDLNGAYYYSSTDTDNYQYTLCTCLENLGDADGVVGNCDSIYYKCNDGTGKNYTLTEP